MTPKWSMRVQERDDNLCVAELHDPRCRLVGHHAHHLVYKSHCPAFTHYTVVGNGAWLSMYCHDLAHKTKNGNISIYRLRIAVDDINAEIDRVEPLKPDLHVRHFERAA